MSDLLQGLFNGILRNMGIEKFAESREGSLPSPVSCIPSSGEKLVTKPESGGGPTHPPSVEPSDQEVSEVLSILVETEKECRMFGQGMVTLGTCDWPDVPNRPYDDIFCCKDKATYLFFDASTDPIELCQRHYLQYLRQR